MPGEATVRTRCTTPRMESRSKGRHERGWRPPAGPGSLTCVNATESTTWRLACTTGLIAAAFLAAALGSLGVTARTCTGDLIRADGETVSESDISGPVLATSSLRLTTSSWLPSLFDTTSGTRLYQLGPMKLRSHYETGYHSRPGTESLDLEAPGSCSQREIALFTLTSDSAGTLGGSSAQLRWDAVHERYIITFSMFYPMAGPGVLIAGATCMRPNTLGAASTKRPLGTLRSDCAASSASVTSLRILRARSR